MTGRTGVASLRTVVLSHVVVGTLNAVLNAGLLAAAAAAAAVGRHAYVLATARSLALGRVTGATNSDEVHATH